MCHEEIVTAFRGTVHSVSERGAPSCATCHGNGIAHMEEGGEAELIAKPKGLSGQQLCLSCHQTIHTMFSMRSTHSDTEVFCDSCHAIHPADTPRPALLHDSPNAVCATCHAAQSNSFRRPYGHRLDRGGLECVSCHNPHGGSGEYSLVVNRAGEGPCVTCHAEKRVVKPNGTETLTRRPAVPGVPQPDRGRHARLPAAGVPRPAQSALPRVHSVPRGDPRLEPVTRADQVGGGR
jgi:DmsE family decaheme c-type cytochrome